MMDQRAISVVEQYAGIYNHTPISTTGTTPVEIALIEIPDYNAGILEVEVIGMEETGAGAVTATRIVRFIKVGTLTIGTPVDLLAVETDLSGGDFSIVNSSENIQVKVTGTADTINWNCQTKILLVNATVLP
jgi:hypothetical protein